VTGCPVWCVEPHDDGERRHLAEMRDVPVMADRTADNLPMLFADLRQAPGDDRPLIHLDLDEVPVARLGEVEALALAKHLIELVELSRTGTPTDRRGGESAPRRPAAAPPTGGRP
jgi:hypothetical protein